MSFVAHDYSNKKNLCSESPSVNVFQKGGCIVIGGPPIQLCLCSEDDGHANSKCYRNAVPRCRRTHHKCV